MTIKKINVECDDCKHVQKVQKVELFRASKPRCEMCGCTRLQAAVECSGCGVCCMHMSLPPYNAAEEADLPKEVAFDLGHCRDAKRMQENAHGILDQSCAFFDWTTRRCIHYDHRPQVCKDFEVGSYDCREIRLKAGLSG